MRGTFTFSRLVLRLNFIQKIFCFFFNENTIYETEALKGMEKVAEHINEMQRIHEEYGAIFDHLFRQHQKSCKQPIDLSPGTILVKTKNNKKKSKKSIK